MRLTDTKAAIGKVKKGSLNMVRSMIAGVAGLKTHQSKMDVIGNNIANVNTWGFKSYSFNFQDSMYTNSINSSEGSTLAGAAGGRNPSQVGYGTTLSSISTEFGTGAPSPSSNPLDCMIDGTGFFLVGTMVNGSFEDVASSGLYLSRVGIFRVDNNGYLVDDQRSYVYGYALVEGTGIPETPATQTTYKITDADITIDDTQTPARITIGGEEATTTNTDINNREAAVADWIKAVTAAGQPFENYSIKLDSIGTNNQTVNLTITHKQTGDNTADTTVTDAFPGLVEVTNVGNDRVPSVPAVYADQLSTLQIPIDPDTGLQYEIQSYKINEDGTIMGTDTQKRAIAIGQIALVTVENPNGLEKTSGYYYTVGANAGTVGALKPNGGPAGKIMGGYLEMANVDLANEFSNMITTQRGFQANSKIITVTDEMLQELVNMKR